MQAWAWATLAVVVAGLLGTLVAILIFAASARVADALIEAFRKGRL